MEKYFTAKSYENYKLVGNPFEENCKLYSDAICKCDRCNGRGVIIARVENDQLIPIPVDDGICYKCNGSGKIHKKIRLYTAKERTALDKAAERRLEARKAEIEARKIKLAAESEQNKKEWLFRNGFGEDGLTWCVFGDNTYAIKEQLKELGCKYSPILKWHSPKPLNVPTGYGMFSISFDEIMKWDAILKNAFFTEEAKSIVDKRFAEAKGPSLSEYVGEIGQRLRNMTAIYKSCRGFDGKFGWTNIYTFEVNKNTLVWFTTSILDIDVGSTVDLTGTIVSYNEYAGIKQTRINRCKIKKVE